MNATAARDLPERARYLWLVFAAPGVFVVHFLASYGTAAVWCARYAARDASLGPVQAAIMAYTVAALAGIAAIGWNGYRRHRHGDETAPHDSDTPEDRHRFLGFATVLLAGLSALATAYVGLGTLFFDTCR
jgi:hypothetical protein